MILRVAGITPVWQVEAPEYPRNKFCCLARGARVLASGAQGWGSGRPREDPQGSWFFWSSAQKRSTGKGSQGSPEKETKS